MDTQTQTPLSVPYAISYDVGSGLDLKALTSGGKDTAKIKGQEFASSKFKFTSDGGTKEVTSSFSRETRLCHVCTTIVQEKCKSVKVRRRKVKTKGCQTETIGPECEDIQM